MKTSPVAFSKPDRDYRVFYLVMTLVIGVVCVSTVVTEPLLREPWRLVAFSLLVIIHIVLHWFLERFALIGWTLAYILVQGLFALALGYLANSVEMVFLYLPLMGEVAGLFGLNRKTLLAVFYYLTLSVINLMIVTGAGFLGWWVVAVIPAAIFTILYTTMYTRQSQARERAQELLEELELANRQLREYADQVEDLTIASERQRMARELHDTLSQGLAGLILQLEAVDAHLAHDQADRARTIIRETMEQARYTMADARRAIDDLRSPFPRGLGETARAEADRFTAATGIPCAVNLALSLPVSEPVAEVAIRVLNEGLTNIARHARAGNVILRIASTIGRHTLDIEISDDGIGFVPQAVEAGHYGLLGLRERVRLAGGDFDVDTAPGKGTRLTIRIPLEGKTADE